MGKHSKPVRWHRPVVATVVVTALVITTVNAFSLSLTSNPQPSLSSLPQALPESNQPDRQTTTVPTPPVAVPTSPSRGYPNLPGREKDAQRPTEGDTRSTLSSEAVAVPTLDQQPSEETPEARSAPPPEPQPDTESESEPPPPAPAPAPNPNSESTSSRCSNLGVLEQVVRACNQIVANVPDLGSIGGFGQRPNNPTSCHPQRLALDFGTGGSNARGDRIAAYVRANKTELGATTILWEVADHFDHVHVSFLPCTR